MGKDVKAQTIYFPKKLVEEIGETKSFNARVIDLVNKGLVFEGKKKINMKMIAEYLCTSWNKKHPDEAIIIN